MSLKEHTAPGSNAAFAFQFERALVWLAKSPSGAAIGIETSDDVTVQTGDGSLLFEQDKHSISDGAHPFGDRSKDLWNTLAIWLEALDTNEVVPESASFLMVTNKMLPDCVAKRIALAKSDDQVQPCMKELEAIAAQPPAGIAPTVERVMCAQSRDNLTKLMLLCNLSDGQQPSADTDYQSLAIPWLQLPESLIAQANSIAQELLGWVVNTALTSWRNGKPAWIKRDHFVNQLAAIVANRQKQITRERAEYLIPITDEQIGKERGRPFVKQLHLVTDDDSLVDSAMREHIRCNIEKSRLSAEGNISDGDWKVFESTLHSRWEKIFNRHLRVAQNASQSEENTGLNVLTETTEQHRERLAGIDTEQVYLTSGTYHRLADGLLVGWHPRFKDLMMTN
jgi:hypothetical protein